MSTVTVGCKHPSGLHLDVFDSGGEARRATLRGTARIFGAADHTVGGYALTEIDADIWERWATANAKSPLVTEGIVFAAPKLAEAQREARTNEGVAPISPPVVADRASGVEIAARA